MASISLVSPIDDAVDVGAYVGLNFKVSFTYLIGGSSEPWGYGDISKTELYINGDWVQTFIGWKESREYVASRTLATQTTYTWQMAAIVELEGEPTWERIWSDGPWTFTTGGPPSAPITPAPGNEGTGIILSGELTWEDGGGADDYDVWFGEVGSLVKQTDAQLETSWTLPALNYGTTYEWRIDASNDAGETAGTSWSFGTISFAPPQISYVSFFRGSSGPYSSPPGIMGIDWRWTGINFIATIRKLVAVADSKVWYESK